MELQTISGRHFWEEMDGIEAEEEDIDGILEEKKGPGGRRWVCSRRAERKLGPFLAEMCKR